MTTECTNNKLTFSRLKSREILAAFDGDFISSDAGLLLLREINHKYKVTEQLAACFKDLRAQEYPGFLTLSLTARTLCTMILPLKRARPCRMNTVLAHLTGNLNRQSGDLFRKSVRNPG
jgi:Transposase DDE domain group 1